MNETERQTCGTDPRPRALPHRPARQAQRAPRHAALPRFPSTGTRSAPAAPTPGLDTTAADHPHDRMRQTRHAAAKRRSRSRTATRNQPAAIALPKQPIGQVLQSAHPYRRTLPLQSLSINRGFIRITGLTATAALLAFPSLVTTLSGCPPGTPSAASRNCGRSSSASRSTTDHSDKPPAPGGGAIVEATKQPGSRYSPHTRPAAASSESASGQWNRPVGIQDQRLATAPPAVATPHRRSAARPHPRPTRRYQPRTTQQPEP
jgi:hypothetical protein